MSFCFRCGKEAHLDKKIDGLVVERYNNIYGTYCLNCGQFIKASEKISFMSEEKEMELELLKEEMREKIRKKLKGEQ
jgi:hypothetical protein